MPSIDKETGFYILEDDARHVFGDMEETDLEALAQAVIALLKNELRLENERRGTQLR